jgi:uncharacterized protein (TIGR03083 family)
VLLWQIGADWRFDPAFGTEVEVTFTEDGPDRTRVHLVHRNLQRYGSNAEQMRAIFDDPAGWTGTLAGFADLCAHHAGTPMKHPTTMQLACEERAEFVDLLAGLSPQQWDHPSLCRGWRVHDVVAHVISYDELSRRQVARRFIRGGLWPPRINAVGLADYTGRAPDQLTDLMRACIPPRGFTAGFGGMIALVDGMIHQQDIRRPLGIARAIPATRLRTVLEYALRTPLIRGGWRTRGLHLIATDLDWTHGSGQEVTGPGEALLMAMAARPDALNQLTGQGKSVLAQRICR